MKNILTKSQVANFPVRHISMSALRTYLTDRQAFFRRYVRLEFDERETPALLEGKAFHAIVEEYWKARMEKIKEFDWGKAIEAGIQSINESDIAGRVDWGKTGSFDKSAKTVWQAVQFYRDALPAYKEVVAVEKEFLSDFEDLDGNKMPVPLKGFCDLIVKDKKDFVIVDHKLVTAVKQQDEPAPAFELQAAVYWFLTRKEYGVNPKRMIFDQIKKTKSQSGDPQIVPYVVEYTPQILIRFLEIYERVIRELAGQPLIDEQTGILKFLPNPFATFGWEEAWQDFCEELELGKAWTLPEIRLLQDNRYSTAGAEALDI